MDQHIHSLVVRQIAKRQNVRPSMRERWCVGKFGEVHAVVDHPHMVLVNAKVHDHFLEKLTLGNHGIGIGQSLPGTSLEPGIGSNPVTRKDVGSMRSNDVGNPQEPLQGAGHVSLRVGSVAVQNVEAMLVMQPDQTGQHQPHSPPLRNWTTKTRNLVPLPL